ncbi:amino acid adenylation domain-containing protein [Streptomyces sp. NPDC001985]|uniref:amino acid adenylation domain-containing protein n=1 Tax=Streptomyces sp. NPDC001985 TaxID=3154406 RepID=UPI003322BCC3
MPSSADPTCLELTAAQLGVWTAQHLDPGSPRYNCGSYLELPGGIDPELMRRAVRRAVDEAEALRVRFHDRDGPGGATPVQTVHPTPADPLELLDTTTAADPMAAAEAWMRADQSEAASLTDGPLARHVLITVAPGTRLLYLRYHHIVMDGYGQTLHLRRIAEICTALAAGTEIPPPRARPLRETVAEAAAYENSAAHTRDRDFWLGRFAERPEPVSLGGQRTHAARSLLRHATDLGEPDLALLREAAHRLSARPSALLIAAVAAYQCRVTGRAETLLNLPVTARQTPAARATPAMLANELPVRFTAAPGTSFADLVARTAGTLGRLLTHQRYRGEELRRDLGMSGSAERLAGTTVNVVTFDTGLSFAGAPSPAHHLSSGPVHDLQLDFFTDARTSRVRLVADADPARYAPGALAGHTRRLLTLLRHALRDPGVPVDRLDLMDGAERDAVLSAGRGPATAYATAELSLHALVERQAARTPDATAVSAAGGTLTYRELTGRARRLAGHLRERGAGPGSVVGVHEERSADLVVDLLAVLMSGAAYLPLDPGLPAARIAFQIEDAAVRTVLSSADLATRPRSAEWPGTEVVPVDKVLPALPESGPPAAVAGPGDTAYVLYTSGSTGAPKGVAVPHRGVVNRLLWMQDEFRIGPGDRVLQKTPYTFDVSVWEFFWPLLTGAALHLAAPGEHRDPRALAETVRRESITTLHFVPPMLDLFLAEPAAARLPSLRRVLCSGEALGPATVRQFFTVYGGPDGPGLHNLYGPTEASIDVTHWPCAPGNDAGPVPIGRAVANTALYVLDAGGEPVPFGVVGELHIGGVQLASGYLNRPDETALRFIRHPLLGRLYRTGDLAALRPDGVAEYHGRIDQQLKIRGQRVEPGEVEAALLALPHVAQAVVTAPRSPGGERQLLAHVVPAPAAPGGAVSEAALLAEVRERLPAPLVPSRIVVLGELPALPSGKVDRAALPPPDNDARPAAGEPADEAERLVLEAWREVLGRDAVDLDRSFFTLGGDSILSIRMRTALERRGLTFPVADLFEAPTVRALARRTRPTAPAAGRAGPFSLLDPADRAALPAGLTDAYPLGSMQTAMLLHGGYEDGSSVYRVVTSVRIGLPFDEAVLRRALDATVRRHPALRTSFHPTGFSEPLQLVHDEVAVGVEVDRALYGAGSEARDEGLRAWADRVKRRAFDLASAPLLAFTAHPLGAESFQLGVVEHHAVLDGFSDAAMLDEIAARYRAGSAGEDLWLPELPSTYRAFVAAERAAAGDAGHRAFWEAELAGAEATPLPRTGATGEPGTACHRRYDVPVGAGTAARLADAARAAGLPLKSVLAAAHAAVLHSLAPGADVVTGTVAHGRLDEDGGDEVIGVFVNTLPLRVSVRGTSWRELARQIHGHERRTAPHRRYPYARVLRDHPAAAPDAYVNFMDFHRQWGAGTAVLDGFGIADTDFPLAVNFLVDPVGGRLGLWLDCDTAVLDPAFCDRLTGYYARALLAFAADPAAAADGCDLRDETERALLSRWNETTPVQGTAVHAHRAFADQAAATPGAVAVLDRGTTLDYAALDARANRLARHLRARGATVGARVGVSVRRGADLVVALLAVIRTGAAYVPMDPDFPAERLRHIAGDAGLDCVLAGPGAEIPDLGDRPVVRLQDEAGPIAARSPAPFDCPAGPGDPVYVIYTSGSTGHPKGTVLLHRNLTNFFAGMDRLIGTGPGATVLALTSVSFDISILELLWPLTRGAAVAIGGERVIDRLVPDPDGDPGEDSFTGLCERHRPALVQATPSFLSAVAAEPEALRSLRSVRTLMAGGEAFPSGLAQRLLTALPDTRVLNGYGPTEATIYSVVHELDRDRDPGAAVPIGRPVANAVLRVCAPDGGELPIGAEGELWIGGDGVAEGYLGRPELTAERFVTAADDGLRHYRTGDRVRRRADGELDFLGRVDRQVKIRGHRVEPDEVESVLSTHPGVATAAVVAVDRAGGQTELVAYVAPAAAHATDDAHLAHLDHWREVWEDTYGAPEPADRPVPPTDLPAAGTDSAATDTAGSGDFAGWLSSYTGAPIPEDEMREWLTGTLDRVAALNARRIVDVGVGVGLFLRELAPGADSYLGLDVSGAALRAAARALCGSGPLPGHVTLRQGDALALADLPSGSADLVLFNSVVQYFPGPGYLRRALAEAIRVAGPSGAVFIGDVRDLTLLDAFHADVQLRRSPPLTPARAVASAASRALADERELCLAPGFFHELSTVAEHPVTVRIDLKRGHGDNELTRFRRDVTLLGPGRATDPPPAGGTGTVGWREAVTASDGTGTGALDALLARTPADRALTLTGVPDERLARPLAALALLRGEPPAHTTAWDLERAVWDAGGPGAVHPEAAARLGERHGRTVRLVPARSGRPGEFDAVIGPARTPASTGPAAHQDPEEQRR